MPWVDDLIEEILLHADDGEYDAAARREYYLRTRKLKGRRRGHFEPAKGDNSAKTQSVLAKKKPVAKGKTKTQIQIAELTARLEKLRKVLKELTEKAKARSGVEPKKDSPSGSKGSAPGKGSSNDKATAKEKAAAKDYYEKHKKDDNSPDAAELKRKIKEVRAKIEQMRKELAEARQKASKRQTDSKKSGQTNR